MSHKTATEGFNLDQGAFIALLLIFVWATLNYTIFAPAREPLLAPSVKHRDAKVPTKEMTDRIELAALSDPFVPNELIQSAPIRVATTKTPPTTRTRTPRTRTPTKPQTPSRYVRLPEKPSARKDPQADKKGEGDKPEATLPLKVVGIVQVDKNGAKEWVVVVKDASGIYQKLGENDIHRIGDDAYSILEVTATSVSFEDQNGKRYFVDKDPLTRALAASLEAAADAENGDGAATAEGGMMAPPGMNGGGQMPPQFGQQGTSPGAQQGGGRGGRGGQSGQGNRRTR